MDSPETRHARTADGVRIAYQVVGEGPADLVFVPGWVSHVELNWQDRAFASFLHRLAATHRLVVFDKRGTGLSDRLHGVPDLEARMDDARAVMDALGLRRAALLGTSEGAAVAALFAATYPERTTAVILHSPNVRSAWAPDFPWGLRPERFEHEQELIRTGWEDGSFARYIAPKIAPAGAADPAFADRLRDYYVASCDRDAALLVNQIWWETDYRAVLPSIHIPTLVTCEPREEDESRYVVDRIAGAELVIIAGEGHLGWTGAPDSLVDEIERFLLEVSDEEADLSRTLATVLFTDIVDSTAQAADVGDRRWRRLVEEHDQVIRSHLGRFRGREVKTMGDGFLATFDGPARAIRCASTAVQAIRRLGIQIRAGLHTGEIELIGDDVGGIAVAIAARVSAMAGPGETLVSQTVKDLVAGSGLTFGVVGDRELKGLPERWRLYRVTGG